MRSKNAWIGRLSPSSCSIALSTSSSTIPLTPSLDVISGHSTGSHGGI
jgi:hypothetical protein